MKTEPELAALAFALIGEGCVLSNAETELLKTVTATGGAKRDVEAARQEISLGRDPLGEAFSSIRSANARRSAGAVYTPALIVKSMMAWLATQEEPARIVDPGAGSGRFILAAAEAFPRAQLFAVENDPLAALMLRANLSVRGWIERATVLVEDFRNVQLPPCAGMTAFIGNPPYVRHHDIPENWKAWYSSNFAKLGIRASALAGLHLHFFLKTRLLSKSGDIGAFITSAEWMDVNYGSALRKLLLDELGSTAFHVLEPTVEAFPGTATTAAITCFRVGDMSQSIRVRSCDEASKLNGLTEGSDVSRESMRAAPRWSIIIRPGDASSAGDLRIGDLFRVHRGQVTGGNAIWIAGKHANLLPKRVKLQAVTKAADLIKAGECLNSGANLRCVVDLPVDLSAFDEEERQHIDAFLSWAKSEGGDQSYIAQHRKAWWSVGLKEPAPILCTYMARRPPQFTLNSCGARHINIAHGLYPRETLDPLAIANLVKWLNQNISTRCGRTYAGGLTKFEPKEIERLRIPSLEALLA
ncbi:MAG: N-6 DNA methylase [Verrucomicrobiales bacterium]|nr:N-6 DNA methylase [Verrucomicrobiales bacterium]